MEPSLQDRLTDRLSGVLGLGHAVDELALAKTDRAQLGSRLLRSLAGERLLEPADVQRVVPRRTWVRRKSEDKLSPAEFDALYRLVRLQLLAELVFGDAERARTWLHTPKARLDGATPMDFACDALGFEAIENWLHEIDQGFLA